MKLLISVLAIGCRISIFSFNCSSVSWNTKASAGNPIWSKEDFLSLSLKNVSFLYACNILGSETTIIGMSEFIDYVISDNPNANINELANRLEFLTRKFNIHGIMDKYRK